MSSLRIPFNLQEIQLVVGPTVPVWKIVLPKPSDLVPDWVEINQVERDFIDQNPGTAAIGAFIAIGAALASQGAYPNSQVDGAGDAMRHCAERRVMRCCLAARSAASGWARAAVHPFSGP